MSRFLYLSLFGIFLLVGCSRPVAKFGYSAKSTIAPAKVDFDNQSEKAETYEWDFGDGNTSTEPSPTHRYEGSGNYTVILKAKKGKKITSTQKQVFIEAPENCLIEIETAYGTMTAVLYDATPQHRDNFIKLIEEEFYNGLIFHRVINGFMIQGGDPESRDAKPGQRLGSGGPGYQVPAEFVDSLFHVKGAIAAARTQNPQKKSSGSQFYIVQGRPVSDQQLSTIAAQKDFYYSQEQKDAYKDLGGTPFLDQDYTVFGRVIKGLDVIDKIASVKTAPGDRPVEDVKMTIRVVK